jgi:hypothetical protein
MRRARLVATEALLPGSIQCFAAYMQM